jgi:hypothetical protein
MEGCEEETGMESQGGIRGIECGSMQRINDETKERMLAGRGEAQAGCEREQGGRGERAIG